MGSLWALLNTFNIMNTITQKLSLVYPYVENDSFKDYIVISSDSLLIINRELELVEWIVEGEDKDGTYMSAETEDDFLDAIIFFKSILLSGDNPTLYI
jgi:hypothetical protein